MGSGTGTKILGFFGMLALVLAVIALVLGSLTPLSLLVLDIVVLWAGSTFRHILHPQQRGGAGKPLAA